MIQPKYPEFLLDIRHFCYFSLVTLGIRPRSRRCAERTRHDEGRWSRPRSRRFHAAIWPRTPVPRIAYLGRDKKKSWPNACKKKWSYIHLYVYCLEYAQILPAGILPRIFPYGTCTKNFVRYVGNSFPFQVLLDVLYNSATNIRGTRIP